MARKFSTAVVIFQKAHGEFMVKKKSTVTKSGRVLSADEPMHSPACARYNGPHGWRTDRACTCGYKTLVGTAEIADALQITKQGVNNWRVRDPSFPKPIAILRMGPIWYLGPIQRWNAQRNTRGSTAKQRKSR